MNASQLFDLLDTWTAHGWLRPLDRAFAQFLRAHHPPGDPDVLLAAALTSHQLGRGHVCLEPAAALADPEGMLALPPEDGPGETLLPRPSQALAELTPAAWTRALRQSPLVADGVADTPLVFDAGRLYLRRYWQYQRQVARDLKSRMGNPVDAPADLAQRIDALFNALRTPDEQAKNRIHWQSVAAAVAAAGSFSIVSGGPGTGKTTTVIRLAGLLQQLALEQGRKLRIELAAPTGKAAARLTESMNHAVSHLPENVRSQVPVAVCTLHRLLGSRPDTRRFIHHRQHQLHVDLLIVDEASMIDLEMMAAVLDALPARARLILLGDKDQLASVEAGSVLGDLCRRADLPGYRPQTIAAIQQNSGYDLQAFQGEGADIDQHIVILRHSHRFEASSGIGALAAAVKTGNSATVESIWKQPFNDIARMNLTGPDDPALARLVRQGRKATESMAPAAGYRDYLKRVQAGPDAGMTPDDWLRAILEDFSRFQLLTPLRKGPWGVAGLNDLTARTLHRAGLIAAIDGWYAGRPVLMTRNDYSLGLMNGDVGIAVPLVMDDGSRKLRVVFPMPGGALKKVLPSRLADAETVFAMTVHKSQGSEFLHVALVLPERMNPILTRELIYTGITRARRQFTCAGPNPDMLAQAVSQRTYRASGLGDLFGKK
jgi:exodeoxyribonuclease V alpha subunit